MKVICLIILIFNALVFDSKAQIHGHILYFSGSYNGETLVIKDNKLKFFKKMKIKVDESTGISNEFLFFDSSFTGSTIMIEIKGRHCFANIPSLQKVDKIKYIYLWYSKCEFKYEILDEPLRNE